MRTSGLYVFAPQCALNKVHSAPDDSVSWEGWFSSCASPGLHTLVLLQTADTAINNRQPLSSGLIDDTVWLRVGPGCQVTAHICSTDAPPAIKSASFVFSCSSSNQLKLVTHASNGLASYNTVHVVSYNPRDTARLVLQVRGEATHCIHPLHNELKQNTDAPPSPLTHALRVLCPDRHTSAWYVGLVD